jgi:methionyl-tRNA formyltransferase
MDIGILVSSSISEFRDRTLQPIIEDDAFNIKVAIIDRHRGKTFKEKLIKNFKRGRGGYMIVMAFKKLFSKKSNTPDRDIEVYCKQHNIEIIETTNPYSKETLDAIKQYKLDTLLLVGGYGIVKESMINLVPQGILSYHHGNMRKYRGMPPAFWELYNNEKEMGMTLQRLSTGLDCGEPIVEKQIPIEKGVSFPALEHRLLEESIDMMYQAVQKISDNHYQTQSIDKLGKVYTLPNLREWLLFTLKMFFRRFNA